jgi:hypothetical protein
MIRPVLRPLISQKEILFVLWLCRGWAASRRPQRVYPNGLLELREVRSFTKSGTQRSIMLVVVEVVFTVTRTSY